MSRFTGHGATFEAAFDAAADAALKAWQPVGPDDMAIVKVESMSALYGGIVGFTGTRAVDVSLRGHGGSSRNLAAVAGPPLLALKFDVLPDAVYANLMPPVRRPQPRQVGLVLSVTNTGGSPYTGQSRDSALARFAILRGRTEIWSHPEIVLQVVTPVTIAPGQSLSFTAMWEMPDAVDLVGADLRAVARFVPSGDTAIHPIDVRAVN